MLLIRPGQHLPRKMMAPWTASVSIPQCWARGKDMKRGRALEKKAKTEKSAMNAALGKV